ERTSEREQWTGDVLGKNRLQQSPAALSESDVRRRQGGSLFQFDNKGIDSSREAEISVRSSKRTVPIARKERPAAIVGNLGKRLSIEGVPVIMIVRKTPDGVRTIRGREDDFPQPRQSTWRGAHVIPGKKDGGIRIGRGVEP